MRKAQLDLKFIWIAITFFPLAGDALATEPFASSELTQNCHKKVMGTDWERMNGAPGEMRWAFSGVGTNQQAAVSDAKNQALAMYSDDYCEKWLAKWRGSIVVHKDSDIPSQIRNSQVANQYAAARYVKNVSRGFPVGITRDPPHMGPDCGHGVYLEGSWRATCRWERACSYERFRYITEEVCNTAKKDETFTLSCKYRRLDKDTDEWISDPSYVDEYTIDLKNGKYFNWQLSHWEKIHDVSENYLSLQDEAPYAGAAFSTYINRYNGEYKKSFVTPALTSFNEGTCHLIKMKWPKAAKF